jgi:hypothetical protein
MQRRGTIIVAFARASAPLLTACPGTETKGCGPLTATVGGQWTRPFQTEVNTRANINDSGTTIEGASSTMHWQRQVDSNQQLHNAIHVVLAPGACRRWTLQYPEAF